MKCPKCGYLGFESVDKCRNCGYEFSLATPTAGAPELPMRAEGDAALLESLDEISFLQSPRPGAAATPVELSDPERGPAARPQRPRGTPLELPLFGSTADDQAPLITKPSPPRTPLSVRRATPEVPRLRTTVPPTATFGRSEIGAPGSATEGDADENGAPAPLMARLAAAGIDLFLLAAIDVLVIYFTAQICGLTLQELSVLPKGPLLAFLAFQNGGYMVAFTMRGQTLGKMAAGIRVVSDDASPLGLGHSVVRTVVWALLAVPAGLGFVTALFGVDHRGLHDRCAGTRVVRTA